MERLGKHVPAVTDTHATIEVLLETGFSTVVRVEAVSNTSTVFLRVVGGDKKRSLESETVKYCRKSHGTRTRV
jgi:hypothetical protein